MPRNLTINDPKVGSFVMPWDGANDPNDNDIDTFIKSKGLNTPKPEPSLGSKLLHQAKNFFVGAPEEEQAKLKEDFAVKHPYLNKFADFMQGSILPKSTEWKSQPETFTGGAAKSIYNDVRGLISPENLAYAGMGAASKVPEVKAPISSVKEAPISQVNEVPKVAAPTNAQPPSSPIKVKVPDGVEVQMRNVKGKVTSVNPKAIEEITSVKGPKLKMHEFAKALREEGISTDYNEGYNPDAKVEPNVKGPKNVDISELKNSRESAKFAGQSASKDFSQLDNSYVTDLHDNMGNTPRPESHALVQLQNAMKEGKEPELERYLNQLHEEIRRAGKGSDLGFKEDYLHQVWANDPEQVDEAFKQVKRLGLKPTFTEEARLPDYESGIKLGLTPKFNSPSELLNNYVNRAYKFIADKDFFDQLKENGQLKTRGQLTPEEFKSWEPLDAKRTPLRSWSNDGKVSSEPFYAPKEIAGDVNDYLRSPEDGSRIDKLAGTSARLFGKAKAVAMTSGTPYTGFNVHGIMNTLPASWMSDNVYGVGRYLKYAARPGLASQVIEANSGELPRLVKAGLSMRSGELGDVKGGKLFEAFKAPLFDQVIPALRIEHALNYEKYLLKKGFSSEEAIRVAVDTANTLFDGDNLSKFIKSKTGQNVARTIAFAPNFFASHLKLGEGMAKAILNPKTAQGAAYQKIVRNALIPIIGTSVYNYARTNGKNSNPFEAFLGKDSKGKSMSTPVLGGHADLLKLLYDEMQETYKGDIEHMAKSAGNFLVNRANFPVQVADDIRRNTDRKGQKMFKRGKPIQSLMNVGEDVASHTLPRWIPDSVEMLRKRASPEQVVSDVAGFPVRFRKKF